MTFHCSAIRNNIRIVGNHDTGTRILPCCVYKTTQNYQTLDEYYSSSEYQSLLTATDWPTGCQRCRVQEQSNQTSYRNQFNHSLASTELVRYEIFPSNICNLKCVMCNSESSSALAQERRQIPIFSNHQVGEFDLSEECLSILQEQTNIESISFLGGEFFLAKGNLELLDFILERNLPCRIVTNATVLEPKLLNKLTQLKQLELQISIDGVDASYEFLRYPANWQKFSNNVTQLIASLKQANINFHFVAQPLNIQNLIPTLDWCNQHRKPTRVTNLVEPKWLGWSILLPDEQVLLEQVIQAQIEQYTLTNKQKTFILNLVNTIKNTQHSSELRVKFINVMSQTLKHRNVSALQTTQQLGVLSILSNALV